jgi:hypothetical protein
MSYDSLFTALVGLLRPSSSCQWLVLTRECWHCNCLHPLLCPCHLLTVLMTPINASNCNCFVPAPSSQQTVLCTDVRPAASACNCKRHTPCRPACSHKNRHEGAAQVLPAFLLQTAHCKQPTRRAHTGSPKGSKSLPCGLQLASPGSDLPMPHPRSSTGGTRHGVAAFACLLLTAQLSPGHTLQETSALQITWISAPYTKVQA